MLSRVSDSFVLALGCLLNLMMISIPLFFVNNIELNCALYSNFWLFYGLISLFFFLEGKLSFTISQYKSTHVVMSKLPYIIGVLVLLIFWVSNVEHAISPNPFSFFSALGCCLILIGIFLRIRSIKTLKMYFVSHIGLLKKHRLITSGIYSYIRHPSEAGLILICFGVSVLLTSFMGFVVTCVFLLPLSLYRISLEDRLLLNCFTTIFDEYKASTPALFPAFMRLKTKSHLSVENL